MRRSSFGGYTRAKDGCIVTFRMPDGSLEVRRFSVVITHIRRRMHRDQGYVQQAIDWADEHEAKIVCISSPETILRDLQGTREQLEPTQGKKHPSDSVFMPEKAMLKGRMDLFEYPGSRV